MPTLKGTEVSLSYLQCFFYFVAFSRNIFHSTWLDTFWTDLEYEIVFVMSLTSYGAYEGYINPKVLRMVFCHVVND